MWSPFEMLVESHYFRIPILGSIEKYDVAPQLPVSIMKWITALRFIKFALIELRVCDCSLGCF